jgi:signal transduction histidine kinase
VAEYSFLPPGAYTFRVLACNNDGIWNENGARLALMVEPQIWQTWWFRLGAVAAAAGAVAGVVRGATRRRYRRKLERVERQRALEKERARIAKDIHDDLGASLTRITLLSQSARGDLERPEQAAADLDRIYTTARELTQAMDEIVWAVNPHHDTLDSLASYLGGFASDFLSAAGVRCRLDVPLRPPPLPVSAEIRHNLFLAFKEALHNIVRHAGASEVRVSLELEHANAGFTLTVQDDGRGFDPDLAHAHGIAARGGSGPRLASGNGLSNMRLRLEEVGGACRIRSTPGAGALIQFRVPPSPPL